MAIVTTQNLDSRRERRIARRRAHILDAAATVFARQGFHRTTTKDIAEAADIAEGTIYNYFNSKEDLVIGLLERLASLEDRRKVLEEALPEDFEAFLVRHLRDRLARAKDNETLIMAVMPELLSSPTLRERYGDRFVRPGMGMFEEHFRARQDAGQIPPIDAALAARLLTATVVGMTVMAMLGDEDSEALWDEPETLAEIITSFVFRGMDGVPRNPPDSAAS